MGGLLDRYLVDTITKVSVKRSAYGDFVHDANGVNYTLGCRFRYYSEGVRFNAENEEQTAAEAQAWFKSTDDIQENDILLYKGAYWEVLRVRPAQKLGKTGIEFLKVSLTKHVIVS